MNVSTRDKTLDLLKTWAIFLVVWQHIIAACGLGLGMQNTPIGRIITMFNMPLFMAITGFFFTSSLSRSLKNIINNKWKSWLMPTLIFSIILVGVRIAYGNIPISASWKRIVVVILFDFLCCYWYIPVAFICCVVAKVVYKINSKTWFLILSILVIASIPVVRIWSIMAYFQAMYPFFIFGILARKHDWRAAISHTPMYGLIAMVGFCGCYWLYTDSSQFFYSFTIVGWKNYWINYGIMLIAGTTGIIISLIFISLLVNYKIVTKLGGYSIGLNTFGIYMIQQMFIQIIEFVSPNIYNMWSLFILAIILLYICYAVVLVLDKYKWTKKYLLGKTRL